MRRLLSACVAVLGAVFVFGFVRGDGKDRMTLKTVQDKRLLTVIVGLPDVDDRYRWLSVYGCSAHVQETGTFCTGDFERESTQEIYGRKQYLFDWRDLPGGTMQITAMAFDVDDRALAQQTVVMFRGR
jgi:hypothetical protein